MVLGVADPAPAFIAPAVSNQLLECLRGGALADEHHVSLLKGVPVATAGGRDFHDPTTAAPGQADVLRGLFGPQPPGDVAPVADLMIGCHEEDLALSLELAADLALEDLLVGFHRQEEVVPLFLVLPKNGR